MPKLAKRYYMSIIKCIYKLIILLIITLGIINFSLRAANAFTVNPGRVELVIRAGESYVGSYIVGNPGNTVIKIRMSAEDWSSQDGRKTEQGDKPFLNWLAFMPQEVELGPNETKTIQYTVNIPKGAKGEYIAMIYFSVLLEPSKATVLVRSRLGNALYAIVAGTEVVAGRIRDINISEREPFRIITNVENMGNIHVRPKGIIKIMKSEPASKAKKRKGIVLLFNEGGFPVLPQQIYPFETRLKEKLSAGRYKLKLAMEYGKAKFNNEIEFVVDKKGEIKVQRKK